MKLSKFKADAAAAEEERKKRRSQLMHGIPNGVVYAGRRMLRDDSADPTVLELLDNLTCPVAGCYGDLQMTGSPSGDPNIFFYTCVRDLGHKYIRDRGKSFTPEEGRRSILDAAAALFDGMGRVAD